MTPGRLLFGPVSPRIAVEHLTFARRENSCLTFGPSGCDVTCQPGENWTRVAARLPEDWTPDVIVLNLAYSVWPPEILNAPVPVVGYAPDWPLHWHYYRLLAPYLDLVWTDGPGAELLARAGVANARAAVPFGLSEAPKPNSPSFAERDLDLVWPGNFNPAIHRDRMHWVARLSALSDRFRVRLIPGLDPERIRPWLSRARAAFLPSFHGGWDALVPISLAAGCVVLRDAPVSEASGLAPGKDYLLFGEDDLERVLEAVLAHPDRSQAIADAGRAHARELATDKLWRMAQESLSREWDRLTSSAAERKSRAAPAAEIVHWQALGAPAADLPADSESGIDCLLAALRQTWGRRTNSAVIKKLRGLTTDAEAGAAASLCLGEWLLARGCGSEAQAVLRRALSIVGGRQEISPALLGVGLLRPGFDSFRVEWEKAGWSNCNDPIAEMKAKRNLLTARCELLLGRAADDGARIVRAARLAPGYMPAVKEAARAAGRIERPDAAIPYLKTALAADPLSDVVARELESALAAAGDPLLVEEHRCARERLARIRAHDEPGRTKSATPASTRPRVSLTMIVKDEADNLPACLDSVHDLVDEIVVVDTGSTDGTPDIAARRGARVIPFRWCDDFSAARNAGLDAARGEWIFWLDADERLLPADRDKLRSVFAGLARDNAAYLMRQLSPSDDPSGAITAVDQVRLFRNRPDVRWEYRIHEQILLSIRRTDADLRPSDVVITHGGYRHAELRGRKTTRNMRLLEIAHKEKPDDPILGFNLAWVYYKAGRLAEALPLLEHARTVLAPRVSIVPKVYRLLGQIFDRLGRPADARETFSAALKLYPDDVELLLHYGLFLQKEREYRRAEASFRRILALPRGPAPVGLDLGLLGYKTRNALGDLFAEEGRWVEAEEQYRTALAEKPKFPPCLVGLASAALALGRPAEATAILDALGRPEPSLRLRVGRLRQALSGKIQISSS